MCYLVSMYISVRRAAEILGVSQQTVRRLLVQGRLPYIRVGRQIRIDDQDLRNLR